MKRTEDRRLALRLAAVFLSLYLGTMAVVTAIQCRTAAEGAVQAVYMELLQTAENLERILTVPESEPPAEWFMRCGSSRQYPPYQDPRMRENAALEALDKTGRTLPGVYACTTLYTENGRPWLASGNHLFVWPFAAMHPRRYIDLDACMTPEQIEELSGLVEQSAVPVAYTSGESIMENGYGDYWYGIEVCGYVRDDDPLAYPESITVFRCRRPDAPSGPEEADEVPPKEETVRVYTFSTASLPLGEMNRFRTRGNEAEVPLRLETAARSWNSGYVLRLKAGKGTRMKYARARLLAPPWDSDAEADVNGTYWRTDETGLETWKKGMHLEIRAQKSIRVNEQEYAVRMDSICYPLEAALPNLMTVYIFSLLMVLVLSGLLYRMLARLWAMERMMEADRRMLSNAVAHDLKTPLGIIRAYSEGLREKIAEDKRDHYLDVIVDETGRADRLLRELLELSRLKSGPDLVLGECVVGPLLARCAARYDGLPEAERLALDCREEVTVQADEARLESVFANLISNALSHVSPDGAVRITLKDGRASVENDGAPIPAEQMAHLWEPFYRGGGQRRDGNGLGLAVAAKILELHHFSCGAENTDRGVRFWVEFHS